MFFWRYQVVRSHTPFQAAWTTQVSDYISAGSAYSIVSITEHQNAPAYTLPKRTATPLLFDAISDGHLGNLD